ncbi:MAG: squalene synthase HpnC [Pseudomonadota bacterium]
MTTAVETPSGKGASDENFPVGSWLLPARLRPHIARYYAFARAIDDIADNPALEPREKIRRLDGFARALETGEGGPEFAKALALRASMIETGVPFRHGTDLTIAFKQDAVKRRYRDWDDLMGYCNNSAAPVGRYLIDLHGEGRHCYPASDALCNALQVLNHLQDCQADYRNLDRVYLPEPWLAEAGGSVEDLDGPRASPALRRVIDRCLDGTAELVRQARPLPDLFRNRRFAMEAAFIWRIADRLLGEISRRDPLAERVVLTKGQFAAAGLWGVAQALLGWRRLAASERAGAA